jgi:hypothetical protein
VPERLGPEERTDGASSGATLSRRSLLKRTAGAAVLLLGGELLSSRRSVLGFTPSVAASDASTFFLFGLPTTDPAQPPFLQATTASGSQISLAPVATQLAAIPVKSPDQRLLGLVSIAEDTEIQLSVSFLDAGSGATTSQGTLDLVGVPQGTSLLITSSFAADSTTLCLILSITVPTPTGMITKPDPVTGGVLQLAGATWVSHHALVYFDGSTSAFTGPFDLADAPSLARVNVTASDTDVYVWTMDEPAAIFRMKGAEGPMPTPRLSVFPLGLGTPRVIVAAPDAWPVNGEPCLPLGSGQIARLVYGTDLEIYSAGDGTMTRFPIPPLAEIGAKPSAPTMELRENGTIFLSAPAIGRAVVVDPSKSFGVLANVSYRPPLYAAGAPSGKAALAAAGDLLYVLGDTQVGGVAAYNVISGLVQQSYTDDRHYSGLHILPSGNLVAVAPTSPRLTILSGTLASIAQMDPELDVVAVY